MKNPRRGADFIGRDLDVEQEVHHVAIFNDVIFIDGTSLPAMPNARRRAAGPAAGITTTVITWCGKYGTVTRLTGTAGSTTEPGACSLSTACCPVKSSGAGMRLVTR